jgi:DNA invertase Pin-like site-specific DNA recombinase
MRKYIAYYRVSRKTQEVSGLGLAAQKTTVAKFIESKEGCLFSEFTEVETGTNKRKRIAIHEAIEEARKQSAILVIAKIDRLSRNVSFISSLMDAGVEFVACDMPSANNFTIHIFSALAEQEANLIGLRTRQALQELKNRGVELGTPTNLTMEARTKGIKTIKENALKNNNNRQAQSIIVSCKEKGLTYRKIASYLNDLNFKTRHGNLFYPLTVQRLYKRWEEKFIAA